jgi:hypothetical protein
MRAVDSGSVDEIHPDFPSDEAATRNSGMLGNIRVSYSYNPALYFANCANITEKTKPRPDVLGVHEMAAMFAVSADTLYDLFAKGELAGRKVGQVADNPRRRDSGVVQNSTPPGRPLSTPSRPLAQVPSVRSYPLVSPLAGADSTQRRLVLDLLR